MPWLMTRTAALSHRLTVRTQEGAAVQRRLQQELVESERRCESGSGPDVRP